MCITTKYKRQLKSISLFTFIYLIVTSTALCQDNIVQSVTTAFNQYHKSSVKEKIFAHTDKNFYVAGEILWFKLYDVDASMHTPLSLSKVAYVEIIDSSATTVLQAKIALDNGDGNGSFYLPLTLASGNYKLKAYTNWMKNFGADYFFEKDIAIINVQKSIDLPKVKPLTFNIQFFPEGGNMVNNILSKVAFKGTDQYGKGVSFKGVLIDNNDTILSFEPQHAGMGYFSLTPLSGHVYKAFITTGLGQTEVKDLPAAYNSGYVMHVTDSLDKVTVSVQSDITSQPIYLLVHTREIIKLFQSQVLQNGKAVFVFDKATTGEGISQLTVFNAQKQPVCERLYFKKPVKQNITLSTDVQVYSARKKVSVKIQANNLAFSDTASISMSVYRIDSLQSLSASTIDSYMLLTSDIKGYVEDPGYYFSNNDNVDIALDNLMLTNGWRRFKWEDILNNSKPYFQYAPEYNGSIIEGTVLNSRTLQPAAGIETYIAVPGSQKSFSTFVSDSTGHVAFELKDMYGSQELIFQAKSQDNNNYKVDIKDPFSKDFSGAPFPLFTFNQSASNLLREQSLSMQVQNIYSAKKLKNFKEPVIDTIPFYTSTDARYLLDNYTRFATIEEILREYVVLVDVRKREGKFHYVVFDNANNQKLANDPLVLIDGVPVTDIDKFMQTDPLKLYKLDVVNRKYFVGHSVFDGILSWTSYKKDMADYDLGEHVTIFDYNALQQEREFYAPVYENLEEITNHLPDFRNVLLWSPDIKISVKTKEITFYTSDLEGKYIVHIEGLSKHGALLSKTLFFNVKNN